jgi:hypothetical protein
VRIESLSGWPLFIKGSYNPASSKVAFALIHQGYGKRIYGLCLGYSHKNRDGSQSGDPHKHKWTYADEKFAYHPPDITATTSQPVEAWEQFCREAKITHSGRLQEPPPIQGELYS